MNRFVILFVALVTWANAAIRLHAEDKPGEQTSAQLNARVQVQLGYLLYLPRDYDKEKAWPLMLFLRGGGARGVLGRGARRGAGNDFPVLLFGGGPRGGGGGRGCGCWMSGRGVGCGVRFLARGVACAVGGVWSGGLRGRGRSRAVAAAAVSGSSVGGGGWRGGGYGRAFVGRVGARWAWVRPPARTRLVGGAAGGAASLWPRAARSTASRSPTSACTTRHSGRSTSIRRVKSWAMKKARSRRKGPIPAISIQGVTCTVTNCIVHHNGDVGIGILGKEKKKTAPLITDNLVYRNMGGGIGVAEGQSRSSEATLATRTCEPGLAVGRLNPIITDNVCFQNIRAGIGCREGSKPVMRGNKCYQNRRAGIGIRMEGTAPVVEGNECYENDMAGIGCRDGASPIIRSNVCRKNKMAGIGCRDRAKPLIVGNECRENEMAGIGVQQKAAAMIQGNKCLDNKLVAIGVTEESTATITDNELSRTGGMPPIIAVKDGSTATIRDNRITGGGVAAVLVQGKATVSGNTFAGVGAKARQCRLGLGEFDGDNLCEIR